MGSHGLLRVFVVVSPVAALLAMLALDKIMRIEIKALNRVLKSAIVLGMFFCRFRVQACPILGMQIWVIKRDFWRGPRESLFPGRCNGFRHQNTRTMCWRIRYPQSMLQKITILGWPASSCILWERMASGWKQKGVGLAQSRADVVVVVSRYQRFRQKRLVSVGDGGVVG